MKTALISVYNKTGIIEFAQELIDLGWNILASDGTAKILKEAGFSVLNVSDLVGAPILGHRVVTLSREIHAGLLAKDEDAVELNNLGIRRIDLVCVDFYPLKEEIKNPNATRESVIEKTDIGGPTLLRSAAKGLRIVICDPEDRKKVLEWLKSGEPEREKFLDFLAAKAEYLVAKYAMDPARYHSKNNYERIFGEKISDCKYGENGWQQASLYSSGTNDLLALDKFKLIEGASPSYNNLCDIDRLLQTITHIAAVFSDKKIAIAVKHGNPCGAAVGDDPILVLQKTIDGDRRAIFGGAVMTNFPIRETEADCLNFYNLDEDVKRRILDAVIAPSFDMWAKDILSRQKGKCRLLANLALEKIDSQSIDSAPRFRFVRGGFLKQSNYNFVLDLANPRVQKYGRIETQQLDDLRLAWAIGTTSNSNTTTIVKNGQLIGNGVGQQDRVGSCSLAVLRAKTGGHNTASASAYSDSFFPFVDGVETLHQAGIKAILASSGSIRDQDTINFCQQNNIALYLIPDELGRGFFGH